MSPPGNPWERPPPRRGGGGRGGRGRGRLWLWLAIVAVVGGLLLLAGRAFDYRPQRVEGWSDVLYLLVLLGLVSSGLVTSRRFHLGQAARHAAIWAAVAGVLLVGYSYRQDLRAVGNPVFGELVPAAPMTTHAGAVEIRRGPDGHFHVQGEVNGVAVRFLIDTGASSIVLTQQDAERIGLAPDRLAYTQTFHTANGTVSGAPVRLDRIAVGSIVYRDVRASVNGGEMSGSLLGMSFLERLRAFGVEGDVLTLRP